MLINALLAFTLLVTPAISADVTLVIQQTVGDAPFKLGNVYPGTRPGSFYRPDLLRYYISNITIHHDGGKSTWIRDWYLLVDAKDEQRYSLGNVDIGSVDSITFFIGVNKDRNHLDPTTYPEWHPLALQVPSMHWGWTAGYRFVTYEGFGGTSANKLSANFQIHTLDDMLYTRVATRASSTRTAGGIDILIKADYKRLLDDIDVSTGLIVHGSTDEAVTLMRNIGSSVYSQGATTSVDEDPSSSARLFPNPASDVVQLPAGTVSARVLDASGRELLRADFQNDATMLSISSLMAGSYAVALQQADRVIRYAPLVVIR